MKYQNIQPEIVSKIFIAGANRLKDKQEYINELNVFPVPDGDTGTNMTMTIQSAAKEVAALSEPTLSELSSAISSGSLRGARGNSGVILSQLLRGFTRVIKEYDELTIENIAEGIIKAKETAYNAVMKPKEGTILTVARVMAERASDYKSSAKDINDFVENVLKAGEEALDSTPDLLPVLKEAGVVDSGGQGLIEFIRGAFDYIEGKKVNIKLEDNAGSVKNEIHITNTKPMHIQYGYCTEFIISTKSKFTKKSEESVKKFLTEIGDSLVCVVDDDLVKIHIHTDNPGKALQKGLLYGELNNIKIDNLRQEHREVLFKNEQKLKKLSDEEKSAINNGPQKKYGFIAISQGDGLSEIFKGLGVDFIIEGGQTMNPSTEDILNALDHINAEKIFVLPNNKNILLAANQASDLSKEKKLFVIPTKTIPQGISALIAYNEESDEKTNIDNMNEAISLVKTGQITYAVKDTTIDKIAIKKNDFMGIGDEGLISSNKNILKTVYSTVNKLVNDDSEFLSIYYGRDVKEKDALKVSKDLEKIYPDLEIEVHYGGQNVYYYIISVE